jgi:hypothetical protein
MDRFARGMIARGPTLAADRETWTGSLHVLELPSPEAAYAFVEREPYNRAGLFEEHLIRRFENRLGRTMWEFAGGSGDPRFLVISPAPVALAVPPERLIVRGDLRTADGGEPAGVALAFEAPARPLVGGEVHHWEFGGRR